MESSPIKVYGQKECKPEEDEHPESDLLGDIHLQVPRALEIALEVTAKP
jgi:hypothetical protein